MVDAQGRLFGKINLIDLAIAAFLLCLVPLGYYASGSVRGRFLLSIESVQPTTITAGAATRLTIMGNSFDDRSTIQVGELPPQQASFINDARLDLAKIPPQIGPGWQPICVTNSRGRFIRRLDAIFVIWQPEIVSVVPRIIPAGAPSRLMITGRYFETGCTVALGPMRPEHFVHVDSTQIQVVILPARDMRGMMDLEFANPDGARTVLQKAVEVVSPPVKVAKASSPPAESVKTVSPPAEPAKTVPPPAEPAKTVSPPSELPPERTPWTDRLPSQFLVTYAFVDLEREQVRQLKRGATEYDPNGGAHRATVVEVLRPRPWVTQAHQAGPDGRSRQTVVARLLLSGTRSPRGSPPVYFYRGEPLIAAGIPIPFRFGGQDLMGLTLVGYPTVVIPHPRSAQ